MNLPFFVDDRLVNGWMAALEEPAAGAIPANLIDRWRADLLTAVQEAREPVPARLTGRFAALDRYLTGIAAGIAAGLGTSPASDGGDSDPVILAAGLLAGAASLQAASDVDRFEVSAGRAAANAVVDTAADGAGLEVVIHAAARAAGQVRARALVSIALDALSRSVATDDEDDDDELNELYAISLLIEPANPTDDLDTISMKRILDELCDEVVWVPDNSGFRLVLTTTEPGALVEIVWSFGRVRNLNIRYLPD